VRREFPFVALLVFLFCGCADLCRNDEVGRVASPDQKVEAVIFQRDCGATTDFSTQISIIPKGGRLPREAGNVFIADTDHGKAPSASWGGPSAEVAWLTNRTLRIVSHPGARIFQQESIISVPTDLKKEDIAIVYGSAVDKAAQPAAGADR
jgi:hypothetical protein